MLETVQALLDAAVDHFAERPAIFFDHDRTLTYATLSKLSCRLANGLGRLGLGKGMPVGVMLGNRVEFPITWIALARIGAAPHHVATVGAALGH
jgi:crotonobetaine/carnitine-CoA ligase